MEGVGEHEGEPNGEDEEEKRIEDRVDPQTVMQLDWEAAYLESAHMSRW